MDPHSSAQDVPRCDLCETDTVHSYCDFCHVNLCISCIGKNISDGYDKHKIVSFQERRSTLIYPKCETHPHKNYKFQCKDCNNIFVCSSCMASKQHKGHNFVEVTEVYKTKKNDIKKDTKVLENHISPTYEEIERDLENQLANLDGGYEKLTTTMSKQGKQWHREIDIIIDKMKTEISEIKERHRELLQKHLNEIKQTQSLIEKTLHALRKIEKSTEISSTIEYCSKIREFSKLPSKVKVTLPTFIPKPIDREKLYSLFGQITPLSTNTKENVLLLNQPNISVRELLDEPELVTTIQTGYKDLRSVTCLNEDRIWTSGETNDIKCFKCFNSKGSLLQTIQKQSGYWPNEIAVNSDEELLYLDDEASTVNKIVNGRTEVLIRLQGWKPSSLCVTSSGDLLVTMFSDDETQSKVVCYLGSTEKQTIQFDDEGKPLYSGNGRLKFIAENRNHDICVADNTPGAVVVVNQDGKLRWRYTGHPSVTENDPFEPYGITTDSQSHILTADSDNHCIHILDQNGQFLRYIDNCDLDEPYGLCVDNNDNLFVCEYREGNHKGHNFVEVTEVYKTKINDIKKDTKELENHISPKYEEIERDLENQLANLDGGYEKLITTMSKQGEQWHREINVVINKMKTEISEIKERHRELLQKHLNEIKQTQSLIKETLHALRKIEKSTEISSTMEYSSKIREFSKLPPKVSLPTFIPKPIDREKLFSLFGQITPLSTATEENVLSLNQPNTLFRELLDEPELVTTIQTGYEYLRNVTCLKEERIWTSGKTNDINCFNIKGSILYTIKKKSGDWPNDIAVDSNGDLLYLDGEGRTVNKVHVVNRQTEEMIRLQGWKPSNLCVTSTGDLLVTMFSDDKTQSKVVRYSGSTEKQTIQFDDEGKPLYSRNANPKYITENRNHDICVADWGARAVVVVHHDGKLRWRYTGQPSLTKNKQFEPCGITTDSQCHILTADSVNQFIHILDQNGRFLRYIDNCDLEEPIGICVDNNENLFVCEFYNGNVKKIKYLK
ncbi:uncharacterized protein LOC128160359 [Crassostrea angulata]|uniref:uncharacterized protein LOC128160359 n=1 Tax=Magallana angulata TaxID=2784310 RepID=UPI0022B20C28|nr:uncharacterized protein LOC128160359 [Crassostrea angulata]